MEHTGILFSLAVVAALYGSVGHGGASGYLAILSLTSLATQGAIWLKPHALILNLVVASLALLHYGRKGYFDYQLIWPFAIASIPFAYIGAYLPVVDWLFDTLLSFTLLWAAWRLLKINRANQTEITSPSVSTGLLTGAGLGFASGLVGVGGGVFLSPLLILKNWATAKITAAVSAFFILVNSIAALGGSFLSDQAVLDKDLISQFILAVLIGGFIGTRFGAEKADENIIRKLLAIVLVFAAARRILGLLGVWL